MARIETYRIMPYRRRVDFPTTRQNWNIVKRLRYLTGCDYYFSSSEGSDANTGTSSDEAWQTINKFNNEVALDTFNGKIVGFKRGDQWGGTGMTINAHDNITIRWYGAAAGSDPIITGLTEVTGLWVVEDVNIWKVTLDGPPSEVRYLYIGGTRYDIGKYPKTGWNHTSSTTNDHTIADNTLIQADDYWNGSEIVVRTNDYILDISKVTDFVNATGTISVANDANRFSYTPISGYGYFFQNSLNVLSELQDDVDATNGDWAYNSITGVLYLYHTTDPNTLTIEVSTTSDLIDIDNASNISISNIELRSCNNNCIDILSSDFITISGCTMEHAESGIYADRTDNIDFTENDIQEVARFGIYCKTCETGTIDKNYIYDVGTIPGQSYNPRVFNTNFNGIQLGVDATNGECRSIDVLRNEVDLIGYSGILFTRTSDILVQYNKVTRMCWTVSDGGGIYTWHNKEGLRANQYVPAYLPCAVRDNYVRGDLLNTNCVDSKLVTDSVPANATQYGIYIDDNSAYITVDGNLVEDCASNFLLRNSQHLTVTNNKTARAYYTELRFRHAGGYDYTMHCVFEDNILATNWEYYVGQPKVYSLQQNYPGKYGQHDAAQSDTVLTDSGESWAIDEMIGYIVYNHTDGGSRGTATDNDATTTTVAGGLAGGTDNNFGNGDNYAIWTNTFANNYMMLCSGNFNALDTHIYTFWDFYGPIHNIAGWQAFMGATDVGEPFDFAASGLADKKDIIFTDYNFSDTQRAVNLSEANRTYWDVDGNQVLSMNLGPYESVVLLRKHDP